MSRKPRRVRDLWVGRMLVQNEVLAGRHGVHAHAVMDQAFFCEMKMLIQKRFYTRLLIRVNALVELLW